MRKLILSLAAAAVLCTSACATTATTTTEPGTGAQNTADSSQQSTSPATTEPDTEVTPFDDEDASDDERVEAGPASFKDVWVYEDGLKVEVIKIGTSRLGEYASTSNDSGEEGDQYIKMKFRVTNGSKAKVDAYTSATLTYGPDGEEADAVYDDEVGDDLSGTILPGRSKTETRGFLVPKKYWKDVVLEYSPTMEHEDALFGGSLS